MALITETGTGAPDSEALCSVAFADSYHAGQGNTLWATLQTAEKEQAIRRGYAYLQQTFRTRWAGYRVSYIQALDWPRYNVARSDGYGGSMGAYGGAGCYPSDSIPREIQQASAEVALRAAGGDLLADVEPTVKQEVVGPISVTYADGVSKNKAYPAIERLLMPFLKAGGGIALVRA